METSAFQLLSSIASNSGPVVSDTPAGLQASGANSHRLLGPYSQRHPYPMGLQGANNSAAVRPDARHIQQALRLFQPMLGPNGPNQFPRPRPSVAAGSVFLGNSEFHRMPTSFPRAPFVGHGQAISTPQHQQQQRPPHPLATYGHPGSYVIGHQQQVPPPPPPDDYGHVMQLLGSALLGASEQQGANRAELTSGATGQNSGLSSQAPTLIESSGIDEQDIISKLSSVCGELVKCLEKNSDASSSSSSSAPAARNGEDAKPAEDKGIPGDSAQGGGSSGLLSEDAKAALLAAQNYYLDHSKICEKALAEQVSFEDAMAELKSKAEGGGGIDLNSIVAASTAGGRPAASPEGPESALPGHCKECAKKPRWEWRYCTHVSHLTATDRFAVLRARFSQTISKKTTETGGGGESDLKLEREGRTDSPVPMEIISDGSASRSKPGHVKKEASIEVAADMDTIVGLRFHADGTPKSVSSGADVVVPQDDDDDTAPQERDFGDVELLDDEDEEEEDVTILEENELYDKTYTDVLAQDPFVAVGYVGFEPFGDTDMPLADATSSSANASNNPDNDIGLIVDGEELTTNIWPYYYAAFFRELGLISEAKQIEEAPNTQGALDIARVIISKLNDEKDPTYEELVQRKAIRWPRLRGRQVMWTALRAKFFMDPKARQWLLNTGTKFLAYSAEGDKYWSTGMSVKQLKGFVMSNALTGDDLASVCLRQQRADVGENIMGFMMCQLRSQIAKVSILSRWRLIFDANVAMVTANQDRSAETRETHGGASAPTKGEQAGNAKIEPVGANRQAAVNLSADFARDGGRESDEEENTGPPPNAEPITVVPGSRVFRAVEVDEPAASERSKGPSYLESSDPRQGRKRRGPVQPVPGSWSSGSEGEYDAGRTAHRRRRHRNMNERIHGNFDRAPSSRSHEVESTDVINAVSTSDLIVQQLQMIANSATDDAQQSLMETDENEPASAANAHPTDVSTPTVDLSRVKPEPSDETAAILEATVRGTTVAEPGAGTSDVSDLNIVKLEPNSNANTATAGPSCHSTSLIPIDPVARLKGLMDISNAADTLANTAAFAAINGAAAALANESIETSMERPGMRSSGEEEDEIVRAKRREKRLAKKLRKKAAKQRRRRQPSSSSDSDSDSSHHSVAGQRDASSNHVGKDIDRPSATEDQTTSSRSERVRESKKAKRKKKSRHYSSSSNDSSDSGASSDSSEETALRYRQKSPAAYRTKRKEVKIKPRPKVRGFAVLNPSPDNCALGGARIAHEPLQVAGAKYHSPIHYFYVKMFEQFQQSVLVDTVQEMAYNENVLGLVVEVFARQGTYSSLSEELINSMTRWGNGKGRRLIKRAILDKMVQDYPLRRRLLQTGDKLIVDATIPDSVWGVGIAADEFADYARDKNYSAEQVRQINEDELSDESIGNNRMGLILSEVRQILKHSYDAVECGAEDELVTRGKKDDRMKLPLVNLTDIAVISKDNHIMLCSGGLGSVLIDGTSYKSLMRYYFEKLFKKFRLNPKQLQTFERGTVAAQLRKYRGWLEYGSGLSRYEIPQVVEWELTEGLMYMRKAMKQKYCQSRELRSALFATRGRLLVEASLGPQESYWGIGMTPENFLRHFKERNYTCSDVHELCERGVDPVIGRNVIGLLLTDVRDELWDWATTQAAAAALVKTEKIKGEPNAKPNRIKREPQ